MWGNRIGQYAVTAAPSPTIAIDTCATSIVFTYVDGRQNPTRESEQRQETEDTCAGLRSGRMLMMRIEKGSVSFFGDNVSGNTVQTQLILFFPVPP